MRSILTAATTVLLGLLPLPTTAGDNAPPPDVLLILLDDLGYGDLSSYGASEEVDYTDFRVVRGLQRKAIGGLDARLEAGHVFGREIRYGSGAPGLEPADTVMLRGRLTY